MRKFPAILLERGMRMSRKITEKIMVETFLLEEGEELHPRRAICIRLDTESALVQAQAKPEELLRQNRKILRHWKKPGGK